MKRITLYALTVLTMLCGCKNDDTDYSAYTTNIGEVTTIYINYDGTRATVSGDTYGVVSVNGADVTVVSQRADSMLLVLSGSTTDGSLLVSRNRKFGILLNGVSITNADGPAINNQCGKALYIETANGTANTLTDGAAYADQAYDQKGTLFSEGQIYFSGTGSLTVTSNCKHAIASDDYIVFNNGSITANATAGNGIKVNDGLWINGGTLDIKTTAAGGRGIKCDSVVVISGGTTTITTEGDCIYDTEKQDYSSSACIKCDYPFTMTGGALTMTSSGDGGKCINCDSDILFSGGTLMAKTTGNNVNSKPKAIKSNTAIVVSGGSFTATVKKSWACDNGYEDESLSDTQLAQKRITVEGSPTKKQILKKSVEIIY